MFDFTVRDRGGRWVLLDAENGDLGHYASQDEALAAAGEWMRLIDRPWPVLICDADGQWRETLVAPTVVH